MDRILIQNKKTKQAFTSRLIHIPNPQLMTFHNKEFSRKYSGSAKKQISVQNPENTQQYLEKKKEYLDTPKKKDKSHRINLNWYHCQSKEMHKFDLIQPRKIKMFSPRILPLDVSSSNKNKRIKSANHNSSQFPLATSFHHQNNSFRLFQYLSRQKDQQLNQQRQEIKEPTKISQQITRVKSCQNPKYMRKWENFKESKSSQIQPNKCPKINPVKKAAKVEQQNLFEFTFGINGILRQSISEAKKNSRMHSETSRKAGFRVLSKQTSYFNKSNSRQPS